MGKPGLTKKRKLEGWTRLAASVARGIGEVGGRETIRDSITILADRRSNTIHRPAINTEKWVISHLELRAAWEEE